ncbi:Zinc finger MYM-type protein 5, partial [Mucuna pruriens]
MSIVNVPKDIFGRHFLASHYIRYCSNGEEQHRSWLVLLKKFGYFFFYLIQVKKTNQLANNGFNDWKHFLKGLKNMNQVVNA